MATPALFLTIIFIVYLLWLDIQRRKTLSWAVWLPTIYLCIVGSRPLSMWFGGGHTYSGGLANNAEGSPIDQIFYFGLLVGCFAVATMRQAKWGRFFSANMPLMFFYAYFTLSIVWSEDPLGSTKRMFKDFGMLFVIGLLLTEKNPLEAIGAVYVRCASILFPLSAVCIRWFPNIARQFSFAGEVMYTGVTTQKNTMGEIVLVFSLFMVWDYLENGPGKLRFNKLPWGRIVVVLLGVWCLQMCQSKTGLMCLMLGTGLLVRRGWMASKMVSHVVLGVAISVPYIVFFAQQFNSVLAPIVSAMGRNMTFTGRTEIWSHIDLNTVNPLIGYGFYNFWGGTGGQRVNELLKSQIPNAHDGYLDIYLDGGLIGLGILCTMLVAYGLRLIKTMNRDRMQRLRFGMLIAAIIYNVSESNWARPSSIWFTTLLILSYVPSIKPASRRALNEAAGAKPELQLQTAKAAVYAKQTQRISLV